MGPAGASGAAVVATGSRKLLPLASEPDVEAPPDWRSLPVFPTHADLAGEPLQLPRRLSEGTFESADEYLMSQVRDGIDSH